MLDYYEKPKKKKKLPKTSSESQQTIKAKPIRNFKIIDDDIDLNNLKPSEESETLVDLLDPEGPIVVSDYVEPKTKVVQKVNHFSDNKWIKLDIVEDEQGEISLSLESKSETLLNKRGIKSINKEIDDDDLDSLPRKKFEVKKEDSDSDLDSLPRKKKTQSENDSDLDLVPRRKKQTSLDNDISPQRRKSNDNDLSPKRNRPIKIEKEEFVDETKVRVRKPTKEEELKKKKNEEKKAKYMEWGKGVVQVKQKEEKLQDALYEADKPLARFKDDKDLDRLLKDKEREDDPMLEYLRKNKKSEDGSEGKIIPKYKGPPPPPNRYNLMPGARWDGVDRSNGFEKKYYESIANKKAKQEEAYKWSVEDM